MNYMGKLWNLCTAMGGPLDDESDSHAGTMTRKKTQTRWLEEAAMETNMASRQDQHV